MTETEKPLVQRSVTPKAGDRTRLKHAIAGLSKTKPASAIWIEAGAGRALVRAASEAGLGEAIDQIRHVIDADFGSPQAVRRATIARAAEVDYSHKKRSGSTGEFARVRIAVTPDETGQGFHFHRQATAAAVPDDFIPGIENGLRAATGPGALAGDPIVDLGVTLIDGAFHDIDSSPRTFEIAASRATQEAWRIGGLAISGPIMRIEVIAPNDCAEWIVADLKARRGRIDRQVTDRGSITIQALAPLAELPGAACRTARL